jgi:hypothetical protein
MWLVIVFNVFFSCITQDDDKLGSSSSSCVGFSWVAKANDEPPGLSSSLGIFFGVLQ